MQNVLCLKERLTIKPLTAYKDEPQYGFAASPTLFFSVSFPLSISSLPYEIPTYPMKRSRAYPLEALYHTTALLTAISHHSELDLHLTQEQKEQKVL